ncbi:C-signal-like [Candoia aspera]|uniref:C-signal-like n=1 Tax=Candoia aspera TaxID=51853 RepID=UPI002FD7D208
MTQVAQNVMVTGSNRGIGFGLVKELVKMNPPPDHIIATCRNPTGSEGKALQDLATKCPNIHVVQLDVTDHSTVKAAVSVVESHLQGQGLNLLINNAGRNSQAAFLEDVDQQDMLLTYNTNAVGPLLIVKEFLPLLKKAAKEMTTKDSGGNKAVVINISSIIGSIGAGFSALMISVPPLYAYRASKAALNMITAGLAMELKQHGILCALLHPGWVKTAMGSEEAPLTVQTSAEGMLKVIANLKPSSSGAFLDWEGNEVAW